MATSGSIFTVVVVVLSGLPESFASEVLPFLSLRKLVLSILRVRLRSSWAPPERPSAAAISLCSFSIAAAKLFPGKHSIAKTCWVTW